MLGHMLLKIAVGKRSNRAFLALPCFFACRVAAQLDAGERLLGCLPGLVRRECAVLTESDSPRRAAAPACPVLDEVNFVSLSG